MFSCGSTEASELHSSSEAFRLTVLSCFVVEKLLRESNIDGLIVLERRGRRAEKEKTDKLSLEAAAINAQMHSNFSSST
jgi:hypothetical protein